MVVYAKHLILLLIVLCLGAGCSKGNAVKLSYALAGVSAPCSGEIVVFKFEDKRKISNLGTDNGGIAITTMSDVADWVGWSLFDELKAAGCETKYRTSTVTPGGAALVTGEVLAVELNQTGTTTYAGKVAVRIMVQKGGQTVHVEKYVSEVEDIVVPGYSSKSEILAEALRGVLNEAVPSILAFSSRQ
jgi:hypothetical protein